MKEDVGILLTKAENDLETAKSLSLDNPKVIRYATLHPEILDNLPNSAEFGNGGGYA